VATLALRTRLTFRDGELVKLRSPPQDDAAVIVCVHPSALKAPANHLSLVLVVAGGAVSWVSAVDEDARMALVPSWASRKSPRSFLRWGTKGCRRLLGIEAREYQVALLGGLRAALRGFVRAS